MMALSIDFREERRCSTSIMMNKTILCFLILISSVPLTISFTDDDIDLNPTTSEKG